MTHQSPLIIISGGRDQPMDLRVSMRNRKLEMTPCGLPLLDVNSPHDQMQHMQAQPYFSREQRLNTGTSSSKLYPLSPPHPEALCSSSVLSTGRLPSEVTNGQLPSSVSCVQYGTAGKMNDNSCAMPATNLNGVPHHLVPVSSSGVLPQEMIIPKQEYIAPGEQDDCDINQPNSMLHINQTGSFVE